jgi:YggT family protein
MFVLGNLLMTVAGILEWVIQLYSIVIVVAALVSWVNADPYNPIVRVLRSLTEPLYFRIRKNLPFARAGGLDLSPLIVLLLLQLFRGVVLQSLYQFGQRL